MASVDFTTKIIGVLVAAYPYAKITKPTITAYVEALADLPDESLELSCKKCLATLKYFPTVAELRSAAAEIQIGTSHFPPALEAWGQMWKEINDSPYHPDANPGELPKLSNAIAARCLKAMGLRYLYCSENGMSDRAQFIKLYDSYVERAKEDAVLPPALKSPENNPALESMANLTKQLSSSRDRQ